METFFICYLVVYTYNLGNFLSGMETLALRPGEDPADRPWKLP